ncbi:hypothetical protein B0H14DRAFT_2952097 [Mycena olivaceomarginata]|nr:hypothetical protein B0H14DRAFT_2952097 [Mycena olivaceomarginata]
MPSPECKSVHELLVDSRQEASDLAADIVRITSKWVLLNQFIDAHLALVCPARSPQTTLCGKYSQPRFHREIHPSADWKPFCSAIYLMNGGCSDLDPSFVDLDWRPFSIDEEFSSGSGGTDNHGSAYDGSAIFSGSHHLTVANRRPTQLWRLLGLAALHRGRWDIHQHHEELPHCFSCAVRLANDPAQRHRPTARNTLELSLWCCRSPT